jgi:catechol 2,3-dioxygenase-like lactoylglutathione lyase family enzyme
MLFHDTPAFSGFAAPDLKVIETFYRDTLGLDVRPGDMGFLELHFVDGHYVVVYDKPDFVPATYTILNFAVDDVEAAVDELIAKGVTMERYDSDQMQADSKGIYRGQGPDIAWFKDPAGNIISVLQQSPPA